MPTIRRKKVLHLPLPPLASTLTPLLAPAPAGGGSRRRGGAGEDTPSDRRKSAGGRGKKDVLLGAAPVLGADGQLKADEQAGPATGIPALDEGREPTEQEVIEFYRARGGAGFRTAQLGPGNGHASSSRPPPNETGASHLDAHTNGHMDSSSKAALSFLLSHAIGEPNEPAPDQSSGTLNGWTPPAPLAHTYGNGIGQGHAHGRAHGASARAGPSKEVKEPEVWWIEQTGEVFLSYEWVSQARLWV